MFKVNDFGKKYKCFAEVLQRIIFYGHVFWQIESVMIHDINYRALAWKLDDDH